MTSREVPKRRSIDCADCPLRPLRLFETFSPETLEFMRGFKVGELHVTAGTPVLIEGTNSPYLYTTLAGMGIRFKTTANGDRQVVNFVLPGDFIGMQAAMMGEMQHSVSASTPLRLCVFDRRAFWDLYRNEPKRAFDLTWLAAVEESFLGEALTSIGQKQGTERLAWALLRLFLRLSELGLQEQGSVPLPYRQQDIADALGLSLVHTNKSLQKLRQAQLLSWSRGRLAIPDPEKLALAANVDLNQPRVRPLM